MSSNLPDDPPRIKSGQPFAMMPHAIGGDRTLHPVDRVVVLALLYYARDKATCCPSNASLAEYVGVSVGAVRRSLATLVERGHVRCKKVKAGPENLTGRVIVLRWRDDRAADPFYYQPPVGVLTREPGGCSPVSTKEEGREELRGGFSDRSAALSPTPGSGDPDESLSSGDSRRGRKRPGDGAKGKRLTEGQRICVNSMKE